MIRLSGRESARTAAACMMTLWRSVTHTPACESWWAAESARLAEVREAREMEWRAAESAASDSLARGLIPRDLAEAIAATRIGGYDA